MSIFPKPTGPYPVGTCSHYFVSNAQAPARELMAYFWYPAQKTDNISAPYAPHVVELIKQDLGAVGFAPEDLQNFDTLQSYATQDAPVCHDGAPFPLIIFHHGFWGMPQEYSMYCENLTSHGYIVLAIAHTGYTRVVHLPDGRIIAANLSLDDLAREDKVLATHHLWLQDTDFILSSLEKLLQDSSKDLYRAMYTDSIGSMGHSFGGSCAVAHGLYDTRIKACINLDGPLIDSKSIELTKPFCLLLAQRTLHEYQHESDDEIAARTPFPPALVAQIRKGYLNNLALFSRAQKNAYLGIIKDADHRIFTDWAILKELPLFSKNKHLFDIEELVGSVNGLHVTATLNKIITSFFDTYLKEKPNSINHTISPNDHIDLQIK